MSEPSDLLSIIKARYLRDKSSIDCSHNNEMKVMAINKVKNIASLLEKNYKQIRGEFDAFDKNLLYHVPEDDVHNKKLWKFFPILLGNAHLYITVNGEKMLNKDFFKHAYDIVTSDPNILGASISTIGPQCKLNAHTGYFNNMPHNCLIRLHLPLVVSSESYEECGMNVYESRNELGYGEPTTEPTMKVSWKEGKVIIFDDSFKHCVWNNTDKSRTVLMVDYFVDSFLSRRLKIFNPLSDKQTSVKQCAHDFNDMIARDFMKLSNG